MGFIKGYVRGRISLLQFFFDMFCGTWARHLWDVLAIHSLAAVRLPKIAGNLCRVERKV